MNILAAATHLNTYRGWTKIINERFEVEHYLRGEKLHRDIEYRICLLLAKYFYEQGADTVPQIRGKLKEWAKENSFFFTVAMNQVAERVISYNMRLLEPEVWISQADVDRILDLCDTENEKKVALGVLCYAKSYADLSGYFKLSLGAMSLWLGIDRRVFKEILNILNQLGYIELVECGDIHSWYQSVVNTQLNTYKLTMPSENSGEFKLQGNDIQALYDWIFYQINYDQEFWVDIPGYNNWYQVSSMGRVKARSREIGGRVWPEKILKIKTLPSGRNYVYLHNPQTHKQDKVAVDKLQSTFS